MAAKWNMYINSNTVLPLYNNYLIIDFINLKDYLILTRGRNTFSNNNGVTGLNNSSKTAALYGSLHFWK